MRKPIFTVALAVALLVTDQATARAEDLSPEVRAQLCREKKAGLAKLEAEAPAIQAQLKQYKAGLENARIENDELDPLSEAAEVGSLRIPEWLQGQEQLRISESLKDPKAYIAREHAEALNKLGKLRNIVRNLERRQIEVGREIGLLRDMVVSLGCDTGTPPVDYRAIDEHSRQFQQPQPGSQTPTSEQPVVPQGAYNTPTPVSGAPGAAAASPPSSGVSFGPPPSYGPQMPWETYLQPEGRSPFGGFPQSGARDDDQPKNPPKPKPGGGSSSGKPKPTPKPAPTPKPGGG